MQLTIVDSTVDYTPRYGDNRTAETPATFELKPLSAGELRGHRLAMARSIDRKRDAETESEFQRVLLAGIRGLANVTVRRIDENGRPVNESPSVAVFLEHAPEALKLELYQALTNPAALSSGVEVDETGN